MAKTPRKPPSQKLDKSAALEQFRERPEGTTLTTDQGVGVTQTNDSLRGGVRGPSLLEDFHLREKITRFDHERIPERVVHARGAAAHGHFQVYEPLAKWTRAAFLNDPSLKTPVFVRFSTVGGSRGSADTVRDVRGFAVKFYTSEGNFDLVGNNMPVFFIQDGIKFPDFVHAVKPEPDHEMPQAASAHDSFWDFVSLQPEAMHMVMWLMSDRALPRSFATMEGFGVHTFRLVDARGKSRFCKFHWKPLKGVHSLVWDEAQKIAGKDPDFNRRDLWESIARGDFPEWELGLQIIEERDEQKFSFDLLDPTKLVPEELVPVQKVGKLTLNRNPDNFFAETEQVAFCVQNLVPGIDVTNDPLMQARLFSYLDTQLTRLGGPNFATIPINRPLAPVHNHQQDGFHRDVVPTGKANYFPNSLNAGGCPFLAKASAGGFTHFPQPVEGVKTRERAPSFGDHYSQAALFLHSQSPPERTHLGKALQFELGKCERMEVRARVVAVLAKIDGELAREVAAGLGLPAPKKEAPPARPAGRGVDVSPALSIVSHPSQVGIKGRKIALLAAPGADGSGAAALTAALEKGGAVVEVVAATLGKLPGGMTAVKTFATSGGSVMYDAVVVADGADGLEGEGAALHFVNEAWVHGKPIAALGEGVALLRAAQIGFAESAAEPVKGATARARAAASKGAAGAGADAARAGAGVARAGAGAAGAGAGAAGAGAAGQGAAGEGIVVGGDAREVARRLTTALGQHRFWGRESDRKVPA